MLNPDPRPHKHPPKRPAAQIVIIDDDSLIRDSIRQVLQSQDVVKFQFYEAGNIADGFKLVNRIRPALVILDLHMPGGNGFELVDRFRRDPQLSNTHVLMMTADDTLINLFRLEDKTIATDPLYSFLGKPFDAEELQAFVFDHLFTFPKPKFRQS